MSQSSLMLLSGEAPNLLTQMDAPVTLDVIDSAILMFQVDYEALLATETTLMDKMACTLFIPDDNTGPGEKCAQIGSPEGCEDCELQHCFLIGTLQQSYAALTATLLEMKTLVKNKTTLYCIGSRTGILIREAPDEKKHVSFDQDTSGATLKMVMQ